jgi:hypothetical protein
MIKSSGHAKNLKIYKTQDSLINTFLLSKSKVIFAQIGSTKTGSVCPKSMFVIIGKLYNQNSQFIIFNKLLS